MLGYLSPHNTVCVCVCVCVACVNWSFDIIIERENLSFHILWGSINCGNDYDWYNIGCIHV